MIDRQQYIDILRAAGDFAHNGRPEFVAMEWMTEGFSSSETREWLRARCFDASIARKLTDIDITPDEAVQPYKNDTIGYAVANMGLTIGEMLEILHKNR